MLDRATARARQPLGLLQRCLAGLMRSFYAATAHVLGFFVRCRGDKRGSSGGAGAMDAMFAVRVDAGVMWLNNHHFVPVVCGFDVV